MPRTTPAGKLPAAPPAANTITQPKHPNSKSSRAPLPKSLLRADLRKTRAGVWAVAVAVIAACGAISGAYLKTWAQERAKANQASPSAEAAVGASTTQSHTTQEAQGSQAAPAPVGKVEAEVDVRDIESAIRTLNNRRGALVMRKMQEEGRLERLKERMRVKAEIEARRAEADRGHAVDGAER
ncbi:uncharacterized protein AB675_2777 [Cyphellophora attinorum]|uniref:Uncharacterized protein n=1 Tax=Cyphellophora attinorum TaxID=1664694 RepID=A0A0N1I0K4_9EURO|nr:uncharacterized protein AB675_2777 [Phialophora attinorum]KPI45060.1 hypothetical protein AB675_2777 [Phialophora attinorum]